MDTQAAESPVAKSSDEYLQGLFERRQDENVCRIDHTLYTDPDLFELEMKLIFEGSWIFLGHESLLQKPYDFITAWMGRKSVIVHRNGEGKLNGFINACPHRGARLCRTERGNKKNFSCSYHGWTFDPEGRAVWVLREDDGYPKDFDKADVNMTRIAHLESYRGFIFGSLNPDVPSLIDHLRGGAAFIDMLVDQCPAGFTVLRGSSSCIYHGNWKLMLENGGGDALHPDYVHKSLLGIAERKRNRNAAIKTMQIDNMHKYAGGLWALGNGHTAMWFNFPNPEDRPIYQQRERLAQEGGQIRADWMTTMFRNLSLYPNLHLLDQMATLIRHFRPIAVDETEITFYCMAPVDESSENRLRRLRQFEEFFMGSGMGTPDDNAIFEECQRGFQGRETGSNFVSFGLHKQHDGTDEIAASLGIELESSGILGSEESTLTEYQQWLSLMTVNE